MLMALLGILIAPAHAQLRIEITEGVVAPTPIAIANFTGPDGKETDEGRLIASIIANDLVSSGLFEPIDEAAFIAPPGSPSIKPNFANWEPLGAKGLLVGSAELDENGKLQVEFVLWDVVKETHTQNRKTEPGYLIVMLLICTLYNLNFVVLLFFSYFLIESMQCSILLL